MGSVGVHGVLCNPLKVGMSWWLSLKVLHATVGRFFMRHFICFSRINLRFVKGSNNIEHLWSYPLLSQIGEGRRKSIERNSALLEDIELAFESDL